MATTHCTQMAVDEVSERQPAELKWKQTQWDSVLGRMLALLYSVPCSPMASSTTTAVRRGGGVREGVVKGNFSIAEAVRQKTAERGE